MHVRGAQDFRLRRVFLAGSDPDSLFSFVTHSSSSAADLDQSHATCPIRHDGDPQRLEPISADDEALRRTADVRERIARDERQPRPAIWIEYPYISWVDHQHLSHTVLKVAMQGRQQQMITDAHALQPSEECVAMAGEGAVAVLSRERRVGKMTDSNSEHRLVIAFHDHSGKSHARNFKRTNERSSLERTRDRPDG
jgi:hypothetical protein